MFFPSFVSYLSGISSFLSVAHALVQPLVRARTHILNTQVSGRPGSYKEVVFIGCPWSLGSASLQPRTSGLSCPPFTSSFVCLFCARTCTLVVPLESKGFLVGFTFCRGQQGVHSFAANEDSCGYSVKQIGTPICVPAFLN